MNEVIDRIADAIMARICAGCDINQHEAELAALSAIEAIREPTSEQVDAACGFQPSDMTIDAREARELIEHHWRAMIDAALAPRQRDEQTGDGA